MLTNKPYILKSIVVHEGTMMQAGHYSAYRLWHPPVVKKQDNLKNSLMSPRLTREFSMECSSTQSNVKWIRTSDSLIKEAKSEEVFGSQAYILFYERDPSAIPAFMRRRRYRALSPTQSDVSTLLRSKDETVSKLSWNISEEDVDLDDLDKFLLDEEDFEDINLYSGLYEDVTKADLIRNMALMY